MAAPLPAAALRASAIAIVMNGNSALTEVLTGCGPIVGAVRAARID